jgi:hypothetical protein
MSGLEAAARWGEPGSGRADFNSNRIIPKFPPNGKLLAYRQRFKNPPKAVFIEVGGNSWKLAKKWNAYPDFAALVLTPELEPSALIWPVKDCHCLIEWGREAPDTLIIELVKSLLSAGALNVCVQPMWVNHDTLGRLKGPNTHEFIPEREVILYYGRKEVHHVIA